jgi:glycosyltransferase involved in cell wall biosynthesis
MIVKNEASIIERCLEAQAKAIDCYVICDTGSTDNTEEIIDEVLTKRHGIPGEIHRINFETFEQARNESLEKTQASKMDFDYILLCDADMILEISNHSWKDSLEYDCYMVNQYNVSSYENARLLKRSADCRYKGVTHEFLECDGTTNFNKNIRYHDLACGASRTDKFVRDERLLLEALETEKDEGMLCRYNFYLAQTYFDLGNFEKAVEYYLKRKEMGGWAEEVFYSTYKAGTGQLHLSNSGRMLELLLDAHNISPFRAEPLYELSRYYRRREQNSVAYLFGKRACTQPFPREGALFVDKLCYDFNRWDELSIAAYWIENYKESYSICNRLISEGLVPDEELDRVKKNLAFAEEKL